jgi:hypothetical protein
LAAALTEKMKTSIMQTSQINSTKAVIDHHLTTVITRFAVPAEVNASDMRGDFAQAAPAFRNVPHLLRKQFLLSPDGRTAGGIYLWENEEAARTFMQQRIAPMIRDKFRVEPTIEFYDSPVIVENVELERQTAVGGVGH